MMSSDSLAALAHRGFALIPNFLRAEELAILCRDFADSSLSSNKNYAVNKVSPSILEHLQMKLLTLAEGASKHGVRANRLTGGTYFSITAGIDFDWHQDHESFYEFQNHFNYLNFYIPIEKPSCEKSNLSIVPMDRLQKRAPQVFSERVGKGACRARVRRDYTILQDDNDGNPSRLDFDLNEIAETPQLNAGDLLLLRGDVFHKTQDRETARTSVSFRMTDSRTVLTREQFLVSCPAKASIISENEAHYSFLLNYFVKQQNPNISIGEYLEANRSISDSP